MAKIHILDTNEIPGWGSMVRTNCGEQADFYPINASWDDERVCEGCLRKHRLEPQVSAEYTFALIQPTAGKV